MEEFYVFLFIIGSVVIVILGVYYGVKSIKEYIDRIKFDRRYNLKPQEIDKAELDKLLKRELERLEAHKKLVSQVNKQKQMRQNAEREEQEEKDTQTKIEKTTSETSELTELNVPEKDEEIEYKKQSINGSIIHETLEGKETKDCLIRTYPEVYYSEVIKKILFEKPELPKEPLVPVKPMRPDEPNTTNPFFIIAIIAAIVICALAYSHNNNSGGGSMVVGIVTCWVFLISMIVAVKRKEKNEKLQKIYENEVRQYQEAIKKYEDDCEKYADKRKDYIDTVTEMKSNEYVMNCRKKEMDKLLRERMKPVFEDLNGDVVKKGRLDDYFANELMLAGYEVVENVKIPVGNTFYYPDVLVKMGNLYIDIEIDEPYSMDNGEPIHYMDDCDDSVDFDRDFYFNDLGYEVIRFAEESVALHLKACVEYIAEVVNAIKAGKEASFYNADIVVKRWDKEDAEAMSKKGYRSVYLGVLTND